MSIENYRGIDYLEVDFDPNINIIIGENGCNKSAVIDAIRLLYNIGEPIRDISVSLNDFHEKATKEEDEIKMETATKVTITYHFKGLTNSQKGAFYEYMVIDPDNKDNDYAKIKLQYENRNGKYPYFTYSINDVEGQRADYKTFELFQHYYLGALRDSTKDLLNSRGNILGKVIRRFVGRKGSEAEIEEIMKTANEKLLERDEVKDTREGVNSNLKGIFKAFEDNKIGLQIEQSKTEYIVNAIKPFLPHNRETLKDEGFHLWQNSLGYNNLIYIATVLGDIKEQIADDGTPHFALLIEEPEAHLHPQLQLSLYNFLEQANKSDNSQLFITSHSPTLTSKVPLKNLILLEKTKAYRLGNLFNDREAERIIEDTSKNNPLTKLDFEIRRKKLERYIDVTKSQLLFAKSGLFVEGISEELLISAFTQVEGYRLEDYRIELVNVRGTSFYPFLYLFNSTDAKKRVDKSIAILTDQDQFISSKKTEYGLDKLLKNNYAKLIELDTKIQAGTPIRRIANLASVANGNASISVNTAFKTLEYELALANVPKDRTKLTANFLFSYLTNLDSSKTDPIKTYTATFANDELSDEEHRRTAILLWKAMPGKAVFAQDFALYILENLDSARQNFVIPQYIKTALSQLN
ncbi:AAA family ATPase [Antarcticibacterium sp. 1MA-6-2]|uniref:ATP-dependent nuclease n=1 Tax=Antarcticibacterium sp. 1MA-6-2 TaxID=2908210 RepID=UPI001F18DC92|nr:AAA family ATPase [Antarcticibacterium sp. 1MA-6-2]UJH90569.1 AAA family ATPase [Antarcticibacterium sp. 1MA-6-2]